MGLPTDLEIWQWESSVGALIVTPRRDPMSQVMWLCVPDHAHAQWAGGAESFCSQIPHMGAGQPARLYLQIDSMQDQA